MAAAEPDHRRVLPPTPDAESPLGELLQSPVPVLEAA